MLLVYGGRHLRVKSPNVAVKDTNRRSSELAHKNERRSKRKGHQHVIYGHPRHDAIILHLVGRNPWKPVESFACLDLEIFAC